MGKLFRVWQTSGADIRFLLTVLRSADRPKWLLPALIALGFFAFDPLNLAILPLGVIDDVVLLPLLLRVLAHLAASSQTRVDPRARDTSVVSVQ